MANNKCSNVQLLLSKCNDYISKYIKKIYDNQISDADLWAKFVLQFQNKTDTNDMGWRGEYWGKVMRGACSIYEFNKNRKLYSVLTDTVRQLIKIANNKDISSYSLKTEFTGWDLWGRKYVLIGLLCYYRICKNKKVKKRILDVVDKNVAYIIKHIGNGKNQTGILQASHIWGGANVSTIIVPFMDYYNICKRGEVLDFVEYVINQGFSSYGNLLECVRQGLIPNEYPVKKAYEITSCFEGLLEYARVTDNKEYLDICFRYFKSLAENELTVTGCLGCWEELFSNGATTQTNEIEVEHQETCVTVTWIGVCYKLLLLTGESVYADYIEQSVVNNLYGASNTNNQKMKLSENKTIDHDNGNKLLAFDSYSPLYYNRRGMKIGGYKAIDGKTIYGCCAAIGAYGLGIYANTNILKNEDMYLFNLFASGMYITNDFTVVQKGSVYKKSLFTLKFVNVKDKITIGIRISKWSKGCLITVDGNVVDYKTINGYAIFDNIVTNSLVQIYCESIVETLRLNGKIAFRKGAVVLARDEQYNDNIKTPICNSKKYIARRLNGNLYNAKLSYKITTQDGASFIISDYSSVGKNWDSPNSMISVWLDVK